MTHRSNQAVASQGQAAPQPAPPPAPRRLLVGWVTALAALGISTALIAGGAWLARLPLGKFFLASTLSQRGIDADFDLAALDLHSATLANLRLGAAAAPDASVQRVELLWNWCGLAPCVRTVRLFSPHLRLRLDEHGRVSAGALQRFRGEPSSRRPSMPALEIAISDGVVDMDAPFGALQASFQGAGVLGRDFAATARIEPTSHATEGYALSAGGAVLTLTSRDNSVRAELDAHADALLWDGAIVQAPRLHGSASAPMDLARFDIDAVWSAAGVSTGDARAHAIVGGGSANIGMQDNRLAPANWRGQVRTDIARAEYGDARAAALRAVLRGAGDVDKSAGGWTLSADNLRAAGIESQRPHASGTLNFAGGWSGDGRLTLEDARALPRTALTLARAFPDTPGAPVGPLLQSARAALTRAASSFTVTAPFTLRREGPVTQLVMHAPAELRAANGVRLNASALRPDQPALLLQFPGASLHGALELNLSGAGAPRVDALVDSVDWAPNAPMEAEGALSISDWRTPDAAFSAEDVTFSLALQPQGRGRMDVLGPARLSGPLANGAVRDLRANLNLALAWGHGWRVQSNSGCVPVQFAGLDAAGLSFADGALSLCPRGAALIAANANGALSGGFDLQNLRLAGHLRSGEPARMTARAIAGRFTGGRGEARLQIEAGAPRLDIDLTQERRLTLALAHLDAQARFSPTWRVEGAFSEGVLSDPNLPGEISAIAGAWSAKNEDGAPVIRMSAAEGLVIANRPATDSERPLFNPVRLRDVGAVMRNGAIEAQGDIVLEAGSHQLAHFAARHDIPAGEGHADVFSQTLAFGPGFQPYDITERARGMVENVRGEAALNARIGWDGARISPTGVLTLNGVSLATATIPIVNDVRGQIAFDDLFRLTTPPGQVVDVGLVNPGVAARDGRVQFQLLGEQRVSIERAEFAYAGGVLSLAPTIVTLGAAETRFEVRLGDVDAADLVQSLSLPDIAATGRVEGAFPLLLTRQRAEIQNGVLRALPGGGVISYVGHAGDGAVGPARIAFDALRSFRYDELEVTLNGDLGGEVVSSINFRGRNSGAPVDLGPIAPGIGNVSVRGVPFHFNVQVTAPFRQLARTAASITDPNALLERARDEGVPEDIDQTPEAPR